LGLLAKRKNGVKGKGRGRTKEGRKGFPIWFKNSYFGIFLGFFGTKFFPF